MAARDGLFSEYLGYAVVFDATERSARVVGVLQGKAPDTAFWFGSLGPVDTGARAGARRLRHDDHGHTRIAAPNVTVASSLLDKEARPWDR